MAPPKTLDFLTLTQGEFAQPTEARIKRGLETPVEKSSPGALQLGAINKITKARLAWAVAELTALNLEKVSAWLDSAAADSPKTAVELLIELLKFTNPQQKSVTVENLPNDTTNYGQWSLSQLQGVALSGLLPDANVVAEQ